MNKTKVTKLENGLTIVTEKNSIDDLAIGVWVKVGLLTENESNNGISHFLEHMAFKGTKTRNAHQLINEIESLGAQTNAYTSIDHTCYHVCLLPEYWKQGINFLADIVLNSNFPEEEVEKERNVILQELKHSLDDPLGVLYDSFKETVYPNQIYGKRILGTEENIRKFTRNDFIEYVNKGYVAENMVISACGKIDHEKFVEEVTKLFANLKSKSELSLAPTKFTFNDAVIHKDIQQSYIIMALKGIPDNHKDKYKMSLFDTILNGGMSCRLFQEVRENNGLGYIITTNSEKCHDSGYYAIVAGVEQEDVDKTINVCKNVLNTMKDSITEEEFTKAKNTLMYALASSSNSCFGVARFNAESVLFRNKIESRNRIKNKILKLTIDDIYKFANKYINGKYAITILTPQ